MTTAPTPSPFPYATPTRGVSSREVLDIDWAYPIYEHPTPEVQGDRTIAVLEKRALPLEQAFAEIAGEDPRPLLVLRECLTCNGTDDALMTRDADNERTMLMSRWFHCVKLPPAVLEENHPFHALFAGKDPGHLFVSRHDGSARLDLDGQQSRSDLWDVMEKMLANEYRDDHDKSLDRLFDVLDELDTVDGKLADYTQQLDRAIEKDGPESRKVEKLRKRIADLEESIEDLKERAGEVSKLRPVEEEAPKST